MNRIVNGMMSETHYGKSWVIGTVDGIICLEIRRLGIINKSLEFKSFAEFMKFIETFKLEEISTIIFEYVVINNDEEDEYDEEIEMFISQDELQDIEEIEYDLMMWGY